MTRFNDYIVEKTSKKEFEDALKNKNIKAGCEFEFYVDGSFADNERVSEIESLIRSSAREIDVANKSIDDYNVDSSRIYREIRDNEDKIKHLQKNANILEDKIAAAIYNKESDEKIDELREELSELESEIEELKGEIKELNGEEEGLMDYHEPIPDVHSLPNTYELMVDITSEVRSQNEFNELCFSWFENGAIKFNPYDIDPYEYVVNSGVPDKGYLEDNGFPFRPKWQAIEDSSLMEGGVEVVTSIHSLPELIDSIEEVFKWIDKNGRTDDTTGFHVHMSIDKSKYELDPLKLVIFADEDYVYKRFENRKDNTYAAGKNKHIEQFEPITQDDLIKIAKMEKLGKVADKSKYMGIHFVDIKDNHVEFRYMGGDDYHTKFKEVREIIANYAHWLSIASDPEYKKQEYIKKINKLVNRVNSSIAYTISSNFTTMISNNLMGDFSAFANKHKISLNVIRRAMKAVLKPFDDAIVDSKAKYIHVSDLPKILKKMSDKFYKLLKIED